MNQLSIFIAYTWDLIFSWNIKFFRINNTKLLFYDSAHFLSRLKTIAFKIFPTDVITRLHMWEQQFH